jgi:hypothetical protein
VVYVGNDEKSVDGMSSAAADPGKRLEMPRSTEGSNFVRINFETPMEVGGLRLSETETSWNVSGDHVTIQWFSDVYKDVSAGLASRDFAPESAPVMGEGDPAFLAVLDPAFFIYTMFPGETDPIKSFLNQYGRAIPPQFAGELEAILRQCRLSVVLVTKGESVSTAYARLDTTANESIDKLYDIASLLVGGNTELDGWESAFKLPAGAGISAIAAKKKGAMFVGAGDLEDFTKAVVVSGDMEKTASPSNVFGMTVTPPLLGVKEGALARMLADAIAGIVKRAEDSGVFALGDMGGFSKIDSFNLRHSINGRMDIDIILRK